jgi:hypothetical protein
MTMNSAHELKARVHPSDRHIPAAHSFAAHAGHSQSFAVNFHPQRGHCMHASNGIDLLVFAIILLF